MLRVAIRRLYHSDQGTRGVLIMPDGVLCNTFELPWRDNLPQKSCIPCGEYDVAIRVSKKFGRIYEVKDVPERSGILFHSGNLAGDMDLGYKSHTRGCILLGKYFGKIDNQLAVLYSRPTVNTFMQLMGEQSFMLIVEDEICGS